VSVLQRSIIRIDEEKCDGCGICANACHEGAIQIIDGKAKLVKESYCDGLGDCIGPCPRDAITIEVRDAEEYDEEAVKVHMKLMAMQTAGDAPGCPSCPGSAIRAMEPPVSEPASDATTPSMLTHWPVQIMLVPPTAPFLQGADLLVAADCVPFAYPDFHSTFIRGRTVLVGCPKLDDAAHYLEKFTAMFRMSDIKSVTVTYMEVPCCGGLIGLINRAIAASGKNIPLRLVKIGIGGDILEDKR